jgi:GH15 family glucan-1,4-alpha-glucosidase
MTDRLKQSYEILDQLRLPNNMYVAALSDDYNFTWIRDSFYEVYCYIDKPCNRYETTFQAILDILHKYEYKIEYHTKVKPTYKHEYIHPRYTVDTLEEVNQEWGNMQNDICGSILFGIGEGIKAGKKIIRNDKDIEILQKLVWYLDTLRYHEDLDNSVWEEQEDIHSSSIGACLAGLLSVSDIVYVPSHMIANGYKALYELFPKETPTRDVDLSLLTLVYPYNIFPKPIAQKIIENVEKELLRDKGVIRYRYDSYYSTLEKEFGRHHQPEFYDQLEPSWTFGLSYLALSHMTIGNLEKGKEYIDRTEKLVLENGYIPELYYAGDYKDEYGNGYNKNNPLGWAVSMHIQAIEMYERLNNESK